MSAVIGEGGSGGALAIGVANRVLVLEYSIYSVISPEGCAASCGRVPRRRSAAEALGITRRAPAPGSGSSTKSCRSRSAARTATRR